MSQLPQFQSNDRDFQLMQNAWASTLNPVILKNNLIGKFLTAQNSTGVTLVTNTIKNLTFLSVPSGTWLLFACAAFPSLPANTTQTIGMISTSPTTQSGQVYDGSTMEFEVTSGAGTLSFGVGPFPVKLSQITPYYLNVRATFTGTAPTAQGTLYAVQLGDF